MLWPAFGAAPFTPSIRITTARWGAGRPSLSLTQAMGPKATHTHTLTRARGPQSVLQFLAPRTLMGMRSLSLMAHAPFHSVRLRLRRRLKVSNSWVSTEAGSRRRESGGQAWGAVCGLRGKTGKCWWRVGVVARADTAAAWCLRASREPRAPAGVLLCYKADACHLCER